MNLTMVCCKKILYIGALSILAVNLFDTTFSKDININKLFTNSDFTWPKLTFEDEKLDKV